MGIIEPTNDSIEARHGWSTPVPMRPGVFSADEDLADLAEQRKTKGPEYGRPHLTGRFVEVDE